MNDITSKTIELLASKICHDLVSPVGAVCNGIEFLEEMGPDAIDDAMGLIKHSSTQASTRLAVFRLVYGAGGADPHIRPETVKTTFGNYIANDDGISQEWTEEAIRNMDTRAGYCKILTGCLVIARDALPYGGVISVSLDRGNTRITATAKEKKVVVHENTTEALYRSIEEEQLNPRLIHPYILSILADSYNYKVSLYQVSEDKLDIVLSNM